MVAAVARFTVNTIHRERFIVTGRMGALPEEPGSTLRNADASTTPGLRQSMFGLNWELELILWRDPVGDALSKKRNPRFDIAVTCRAAPGPRKCTLPRPVRRHLY